MRKRPVFLSIAVFMFSVICLMTACQFPIDPLPWNPPEAPEMTGPFEPNWALQDSELIHSELLNGPEDVAIDPEGRMYCGSADGKIYRIYPEGQIEVFAETGGYPLGLDFDPWGNLIACEPYQGLISVDPTGSVTLLVGNQDAPDGVPFKLIDDVDVASNGKIYFSDASNTFGLGDDYLDCLEARPHGRLLLYDPCTENTEILLDDLYFANGVAISKDEDFVLVNETFRYRIRRYWLVGPQAGTSDIFAENLPGIPDGVSANGEGTFWVAFYTVRDRFLDAIHPHVEMKKLASLFPNLFELATPYGFVASMDETGEAFASYQDPEGTHIRGITSVEEFGGHLYLGTLHRDSIGRFALP